MKTLHKLSALVLVFAVFGCATILAPGPEKFPVDSKPQGAKVYLDGQMVGVTPSIVTVNRKDEGVIRIELKGYEPVTVDRDKVVNGWVFGNILLGGLIGLTVDLITSNQGRYKEDAVMVELRPLGKKHASAESIRVALTPKKECTLN